jgi:acetate kinase
MTQAILVLNAGSSSLKFAVYPAQAGQDEPLLRGKIAGIGAEPVFTVRDAAGQSVPAGVGLAADAGPSAAVAAVLAWVAGHQGGVEVVAAGHRVVHGGRDYTGPARITPSVMADLEALVPLAPLHQPHNLAAIRAVAALSPDLPQTACFDTSFHRSQDRLAQLFALPRAMADEGILRYGFHGLSYDYIASVLPAHLGARVAGRVIVAHLGNGASLCAMTAGKSRATSMGFTALDGLMMGQRCGAIDPGVLLYLAQQKGMEIAAIEHLLYQESGLLGVSGISNDMRVLQDSAAPEAAEAIDLFCLRAAQEMAALCAVIGGLDALVFTAGIGEKSALVREKITARLAWLGIALDPAANAKDATRISGEASTVEVLVIPTNEELVIANATRAVLAGL